MSNWSRDAARKFAENRSTKNTSDQKALQDQALLDREAPVVWSRFIEMFGRACTEFNAESDMSGTLSLNNSRPDVIEISRKDSRLKAKLFFDAPRHQIKITTPGVGNENEEINIAVLEGSRKTRLEDRRNLPVEEDQVVDLVLGRLLEIG